MTDAAGILKQQLKKQGKPYRGVAAELRLSEPSVKRLFASGKFALERLAQISHFPGFTLAELTQEAAATRHRIHILAVSQKQESVSDVKLPLVTIRILNHWTLGDIVNTYRLTGRLPEKMLYLDRLDPIKQYFRNQGLHDSFDGSFFVNEETMLISS